MLRIFASAVSVFAAAAAFVIVGATSASAGWDEGWLFRCLKVELMVPPVEDYVAACPPVAPVEDTAAMIIAVVPDV